MGLWILVRGTSLCIISHSQLWHPSCFVAELDYVAMSDRTPKSPAVPLWEQKSGAASDDQSPFSSPSPSPSCDNTPVPASRQDLIDQASRFLEDESIRDSSMDCKVSFLESKGLNTEEIQQLLGISRNSEASSSSASTTENQGRIQESPPTTPSTTNQHEVTSSSSSIPHVMSQMPSPGTPSTTTTVTSSISGRDVPPIITYPEFLFQSKQSPPLVTLRTILYTLYGTAGLGASIYGASEYLVKPMLANLTTARHELATTAHENLQKLNDKLEKTVSVVPAHLTAHKPNTDERDEVPGDEDSVTSDPTELFHRDIGTQTTSILSQSSTASTSTEAPNDPANAPSSAVSHHVNRIESIQAQLKEVSEFERHSNILEDSMRARLTDLHHYLDGIIYSAPSYAPAGPSYGLYGGFNGGEQGSNSTGLRKSEDDAIASFKADIRGVKGALLSARNFPVGRAGRLGGLSASGR